MKISTVIYTIIACILVTAICSYLAGRQEGVRHAIEDSVIWTVECYDPNDPGANARTDGADQTIYIDLDGNLYEHGMLQG